ncbi:response regulator [Neobacillus sp. YIM B06451]|uniref:response regulator n=1 Tax=Neobacillus sp. YIM B06451 TaxID=3070994 RepID=UPI00293142A3|nr:response regulator [Neobacillus sp. YIM B06451]
MTRAAIKVLIVDDDTIVRRGLTATVDWERFGMAVVGEAPNGKRGWEEFLRHEPDVVITDIVMPEENGLEFSRKVKASRPRTKILLLSCHKDFEYAQEGLKLGASGYLLKTDFDDQELSQFLSSFQNELSETATKPETDYSGLPKAVQQAIEYIARNLSNPMTVEDIADDIGMSRSHLSTLFKKNLGCSIHSFIEGKRLQLAKQLLKGTNVTIQEVGEQIGILDAKYFSKWFKRCTGLPPSDYRNEQKDEN